MASTVPNTMLAARVNAYSTPPKFDLEQIPLPQLGHAEVLIRVTAAGLCHTDIGVAQGHKANEGSKVPMTAGHEPAGVVLAVGSRVERFKEGDRVGFVNHKGSCGKSQMRLTHCRVLTWLLSRCRTLRRVHGRPTSIRILPILRDEAKGCQ